MPWNADEYRDFFVKQNRFEPYEFQMRAAEMLAERKNLVLAAPTGAGKTLTVLTPFLFGGWVDRPTRLIYAVPLRTLAQGIYEEARALARRAGKDPDEFVRMQTGEQPDDPFFELGKIVVTTYDQVLSGLLSGPYGLSGSLHNINSAAIAGALVVFDEFHLMEPQRAFLTGAAGLHLFRDLTQCVWMTATATSPLCDELRSAVGAEDASPSEAEIADLPTVAKVTRTLTLEAQPLSAESVLRASSGRTIVICNTVPRAQALYHALRAELPDDVPVLLLHSRFFKTDRAEKVAALRRLFGKEASGRAVLIATQVIEAGVDISCDDLHTELCPMNALVQRAGRCARYPGEDGTVHVYPLLEDAPAWLPYGTLQAPDETLDATLKVLEQHTLSSQPLTPGVSGQWVEMVHRKLDESTLRDGWQQRLDVMLGRIHQNSIQRNPTRVSDLIREESVDEISVIVAKPANLPDAPGKREAVSISRWQLRPFVNDASGVEQSPRAWTWSFGDADPGVLPHWEPLETDAQLRRAFVVCVSPAVASYSKEAGLEIGTSGDEESPERALPPKRGYKPLHRESWAKHARAVAQAAERRTIEQDGVPGFLGNGLEARFGLTAAEVQRAAYASGVLHDLGKLQVSWQRWAEAWQKKKEAGYEHLEGLAHTDFDPDNFEDRAANRGFQPRRPPHAAASALVACGLLAQELRVAPEREGLLASAVLASVLAHHGGWLPHAPDMGIDPLWARWQPDLAAAHIEHTSAALIDELYRQKNRSGIVGELLDVTTTLDTLRDAWPLVSYLMRTLRLADQRATAEGSEGVC